MHHDRALSVMMVEPKGRYIADSLQIRTGSTEIGHPINSESGVVILNIMNSHV